MEVAVQAAGTGGLEGSIGVEHTSKPVMQFGSETEEDLFCYGVLFYVKKYTVTTRARYTPKHGHF